MSVARTINILGALAMGLTQEIEAAVARQSKLSGLAPDGLCVIGHYPQLSIDDLRRVLGLSHPGAVRLVDRLAWDGLVKRRPAADGRAVALVLTRKGERQVDAILAERRRGLAVAVEGLTPASAPASTRSSKSSCAPCRAISTTPCRSAVIARWRCASAVRSATARASPRRSDRWGTVIGR